MRVGDYSPEALEDLLAGEGLILQNGPFRVRVKAPQVPLGKVLHLLYADHPLCPAASFTDVDIRLRRPLNLRHWWNPQVVFEVDGFTPFAPFPLDHAFPLLEWGLNWCIATRAQQYLMLHSGALEKSGRAILLPALPGSGKSTLTAALASHGWRLLSDEFGLVRPEDGMLISFPRPIPLKNESISVIRRFASEAVLGPIFTKTRKGDVAHLKAAEESVLRVDEPARPAWVVFPSFASDAALELAPMAKSRAFLKLSGNAFNYEIQGARGFAAVARIVKECDCYRLSYGNLQEAIEALDELVSAT